MAREKEDYRENLAILNERFPDHDMLSVKEVMAVTGMKSDKTVRKHFAEYLQRSTLSKARLARWMCG